MDETERSQARCCGPKQGEFVPILRGRRSHWKALRKKEAVFYLHFDKTSLATMWRMYMAPQGDGIVGSWYGPGKEVTLA